MSQSTVIAARVPNETAKQLRNVAARFELPVSDVLAAAIERYLLHDDPHDDDRERMDRAWERALEPVARGGGR
jgi:hypothetical protein